MNIRHRTHIKAIGVVSPSWLTRPLLVAAYSGGHRRTRRKGRATAAADSRRDRHDRD